MDREASEPFVLEHLSSPGGRSPLSIRRIIPTLPGLEGISQQYFLTYISAFLNSG